MFVRSTRFDLILSSLFVVAVGACGNIGGCGACNTVQPLPGGKLPADQTVEGGAQIRVTPTGFNKLTSILPGVINSGFANGFCVPKGSALGFVDYCNTTQGQCAPGCKVNVGLNGINIGVNPGNQSMHMHVDAHGSTSVHLSAGILGSCTMSVNVNHLIADLDVVFGIDPGTGELTIHANTINQFSFNDFNFNGCGILSDIATVVVDVLNSAIGQFVIQLLTPVIDNLIQGFLPKPLGMAGMMDVGKLLEGVSPGTEGLMEARIVPGGYVGLNNGGLSLGVITGLNADEDPTTRQPGLQSEPALCVPPLPPPNFGAPPANLPITARSTYLLNAANEFNGVPSDPNTDIAMGVSETMLDLAGHHLVTSGAMCLGVGTSLIKQLNVGTIGVLVPSVAELGSDAGNDPLLLVTRPTRALDFTIGNNTMDSPAITIGISHMEVDFYAFLYERYVRAFTMDLTMNVGVNLDFEQQPGMPAVIKPTLVGISADKVTITVLNSQFVRESAQKLEMTLPTVFSLITPLLGNLPDIKVPTFAGFSLNNLSIQHVTTQQDDFLALFAQLGASQLMRQMGQTDPFMSDAVHQLDAAVVPLQTVSTGRAKLLGVATPQPEKIRSALYKEQGGAMPTVTFEVDSVDAQGRQLEWAYNLDGGLYHPYVKPIMGQLVVADTAFAWQGKYKVGLKSRVVGDYHTVKALEPTPVIIDSVGPKIFGEKAKLEDDTLSVPLFDVVSENTVQYAFGRPGLDGPQTKWFDGSVAQIRRSDMRALIDAGAIVVYAKDEAGNTAMALIAPFHGQPGEGGCQCNANGPSTSGVALVLLVGLVLAGVRRRRRVLRLVVRRIRIGRAKPFVVTFVAWVGLSTILSLAPGCSCGESPSACETTEDCTGGCPDGQLPFCLDNMCVCSDDIPLGHLGPYSDVAVGGDGSIWVSAYHQSYGDLVVAKAGPGRVPVEAWEWVDGVPAGAPVVVPGSKIRGGMDQKGPDVGMYTSIQVGPTGLPMVTYFDRDTASLKFAAKLADGTWQIHVVDAGTGTLGENGALVGMYTSLQLRTDDGRPGVAYLAHVLDSKGARAEVRYASSQVPVPTSSGDWQTWVVDTAPLPPMDPQKPNIYPLPEGLGLFIDSARMPNQAPVVVYYDRANGDLKLAKFDTQTGQFAAPKTLDGSGNVDAGWAPSVQVDKNGVVHVAYVGATQDDLKYITDAAGAKAEVVDDGRRIVGTTVDGLPKPEYHFVGDDASLVLANGLTLPMIAYQDATTQELLLATKQQDGTWQHVNIAGAADPWPGAYGFFASDVVTASEIVMSTWVIDQPTNDNWVEIFKRPTVIQ